MSLLCLKPFALLAALGIAAWLFPNVLPAQLRRPARVISVLVAINLCAFTLLPMMMITAAIFGDVVQNSITSDTTSMSVDGKERLVSSGGKVGRIYKTNLNISNSTLHGYPLAVDIVGDENIFAPFDGTVTKNGCGTWSAFGLPGADHAVCGRKATWLEMTSTDGRYHMILLHGDYIPREGTKVKKGQLIGYQRCYGWCTGPHSHVNLSDSGVVVNYLDYQDTAVSGTELVQDHGIKTSQYTPDARIAALLDGMLKIDPKAAVPGRPGGNPLRVSHYDPSLGGTNCDSDCSTMASGDKVAQWVGGNSGIYAAACPAEWPFGTRFEVYGKVYECRDRGGWIRTRQVGEFDPAMGGFTAQETYHWVDLLDTPPVAYGALVYDWHFVD